MALSDKDILITPNSGSSTDDPKIEFTGATSSSSSTITVSAIDLDGGTLSFEGSAGQLFSVTNNLTSGSIFSVNDVSGVPSIDVNADGTILLAPFETTPLIGIGKTNPDYALDIKGTTFGGPFVGNSTLATFDPPGGGAGTDTATEVAFAFGSGQRIAGYSNGFIRTLLKWDASADLALGQGGTTLIGGINLLPGSNGVAKVNGNTIWHAGNDGSGSGLDADTLDGQNLDANATANTVVSRDGAADINCRLLRPNYTNQSTISGAIAYRINNSTDNYVRFCSDTTAIRTFLGVSATASDTNYLRSNAFDIFEGTTSGHYLRFQCFSGRTANSTSGNLFPLEVYQATPNTDAAITFHINNDYAAYFGLDGTTNDLFYGGWSAGAAKYKVWHAGNDGAGSGLDADNLDGYTWASSGKNVRATEFYADNWFRNYNAGEGLYNEATGCHFASDGTDQWTVRDSGNSIRIEFKTNGTTRRASLYADNGSSIGFLNAANQWALRYLSNDGNSPNLYFREESNETWTGNPGNDQGKIEYHSNRFYIAAGANSTEVCVFRRSGSDIVRISNSGAITASGDVTAFSDINLKENIEVIPNALNKVSQIRGITFDRIDIDDEPRQSGVIAQEVEKVLPEVVRTTQDGTKTVAYGNMVGLLIEAIKEQQKQIDDLKAKLEENN